MRGGRQDKRVLTPFIFRLLFSAARFSDAFRASQLRNSFTCASVTTRPRPIDNSFATAKLPSVVRSHQTPVQWGFLIADKGEG
jgi:hypothetical protein